MKQLQPNKLLRKLIKIQVDIEKTINFLKNDLKPSLTHNPKVICENCGVINVRVRKNQSYFCRSCGFDSQNKGVKNVK